MNDTKAKAGRVGGLGRGAARADMELHRGHTKTLASRGVPSATATEALAVQRELSRAWELKSVSRTQSTTFDRAVLKRSITVLDSGIWLTKRDGSRIFLIGFGGSLIGALTGYRSFRKKLLILQEAANRYRNDAGSAATRDTVRLGLPVLAGWIVVLEAAVLIGRAFH